MKITANGNRLTVDVHGMRSAEVQFRLEALVESCSAEVSEIVVIHGFNNGRVLLETVRALESPRIKSISSSYNAGQTIIALRKKH